MSGRTRHSLETATEEAKRLSESVVAYRGSLYQISEYVGCGVDSVKRMIRSGYVQPEYVKKIREFFKERQCFW